MTLQPQNPEDISRNPQLRLQLDRIEAASEGKRDEPGRCTIVFSEGARSDLEKIVLRLTDPERYREMCDQIEARWAQSWEELARYNPPELRLSLAPQALHMSEVMRYLRYYEDKTKLPSDAPPSLQVLIESPAVKDDFFNAFKISNVSTVLSWYSLLSSEEREGLGNDLERVAQAVRSSEAAQSCGRYLIIPDSMDLAAPPTFVHLAKQYIAQKTSLTFSESCDLIVHSNKLRYQESLAKMGFGEWFAHKTLDLIFVPLILTVERFKHPKEISASAAEVRKQFPILTEWNPDMMNPLFPTDAPIRDYVQLDPDAV